MGPSASEPRASRSITACLAGAMYLSGEFAFRRNSGPLCQLESGAWCPCSRSSDRNALETHPLPQAWSNQTVAPFPPHSADVLKPIFYSCLKPR